MKKARSLLAIILMLLLLQACSTNSNKADHDQQMTTAAFNLQKARTFIDSVNSKFSEQFRNGDSVGLASWYASDAAILMSNGEPITGKDILPAWGKMTHAGVRDFTFVTTDLSGDENFLIETGNYEMKDASATLVDRGKYVVVYKKENGVWKLYRDIGNTSLPADKAH